MIPVLDVYLTGQCNYKCPYCYGENSSELYMTEVVYNHVVGYAHYIGAAISFTGGEPLLHPDIEKFIHIAINKGIKLHLHTNGILLKTISRVISNFEWVCISLDGTERVNHKLRPCSEGYEISSYEKFYTPLENLIYLKENHPKVKTLLATVATSKNIPSIKDLSEYLFLKKIPFEKWKIYQFTANNFRSLDNRKAFEVNPHDLKTIEEEILKLHPNTVFKYGSGDCFLVSVNGDIRVNSDVVSKISAPHDLVNNKVREFCRVDKITRNKQVTY